MRNPRRSQPTASATLPIASGDWTLKFDPKARLNVSVESPPKASQLNLWLWSFIIVSLMLFFTWIVLNWLYVIGTSESSHMFLRDAKLDIAVTYPDYATFKDESELMMNITNTGLEKFTGEITFLFQGAIPTYPLPGETATAKLEKLMPGDKHSHRVKFAVRQQPSWFSGEAVTTKLKVTTDECSFQSLAGPSITLAGVGLPLRTINGFLTSPIGLAIAGAFALLIWEVIRKHLFGLEAKG